MFFQESKMDWTQMCRSCMKRISLRSKRPVSMTTLEKFCFSININVSEEINLPKQFCSICINKIESAYAFITEAQKINSTLKNLVCRAKTSVIVETVQNRTNVSSEPGNAEFTSFKEEKSLNTLANEKDDFLHKQDSVADESTNSINDVIKFEKDNFCLSDDDISDSGETNKKENKDDKKNICPICFRTFGSKRWYHKHLIKEHGKKSFICKSCPRTFTAQSKWRNHLRIHSTERNFSCVQCGRSYKSRKLLSNHMYNHKDGKPFVCEVCSKSFKRKSILIYHMQFHNEKKLLCNVCGMRFINKSNLTTHMRIHTGEKPFKCGDCSKAFNTTSSLRRHERAHRGEAPYVCEACQKAFTCLASLVRHRRTHTGELPYQCPRCPRAFLDSWKRKVHMMRSHNLSLSEVPALSRDGSVCGARGPGCGARGPGCGARGPGRPALHQPHATAVQEVDAR